MRGRRRQVLQLGILVAASVLSVPAAWAHPPAAEQARIDALLAAVAADHDSRFMRWGIGYSGPNAARFLRGKLEARGAGVRTAEEFIEKTASRSSTTGQPYLVCTADGRCVEAGTHLRALLLRVAPKP
jgi:Family of unknown function (DUF5329)